MLDSHKNTAIKMGSDRGFGLVFAIFFTVIGGLPYLSDRLSDRPLRLWAFAVAAVFLVVSWLAPKILRPLNTIWFRFGLLLSKIMNPAILGVLFFLVITPLAVLARATGQDFLNLKVQRAAKSFWKIRGAQNSDMQRQF